MIPEPNSGCWLWLGSINGDGYATYGRPRGEPKTVHRLVLGILEPLIPGLTVDHLCVTQICVNPGHLEQVTAAVNTHRRQLRNNVCHLGHPLTDDNVMRKVRTTRSGGSRIERACLACHAERNRAYRAMKAVVS